MLIHKWWINLLLALTTAAMAYGFASLALDSGNLLEYLAAIIFSGLAAGRLTRSLRPAHNH